MSSYRTLVPMRWSDMDVYRHINNVQVVRLLEEARVQAFTAWDDPGERPVLESGVLVARTEVEYLRQLDFRIEPIAIDLWVSKMSGATIELGYEVREPDDDSPPYARAESTLVMFDLQAGRPRRLSPVELQRLSQWTGDPVADALAPVSPCAAPRGLELADAETFRDLATYLSRARRVDPDGAARLMADGGVLAAYVSPVHGAPGPTVLGLRAARARRRRRSSST